MTNADYVAIAVSPALIMALVGSLVLFLIEVLYVGQYQARLSYAFALFVFAAVLVGRISIELGSERAAIFALPLGIAMYLVLVKFVEHPSAFSPLFNVLLIAVVWWCAHKLTWDCTLIDDEEDASGEGLMRKIGVDVPVAYDDPALRGRADNEMFAGEAPVPDPGSRGSRQPNRRPHAPGLWVLYFSLAALPLFGLGQTWIPAHDAGRRRYAFALLVVYVSAGLALLVTTSFLGLRRYLRQRRVEMPGPMAATWIGTGAALITIVLLTAALIPRPNAEFAISRVPWRVGSPGSHRASRVNFGSEPSQEKVPTGGVTSAEEDGGSGGVDERRPDERATPGDDAQKSDSRQSQRSPTDDDGSFTESRESSPEPPADSAAADAPPPRASDETRGEQDDAEASTSSTADQGDRRTSERQDGGRQMDGSRSAAGRPSTKPDPSGLSLHLPVVGLSGMFKLIFYAVGLLVIAYLLWKHRRPLLQAAIDIVGELRALLARLFGRRGEGPAVAEDVPSGQQAPKLPGFSDFRDPFVSGRCQQCSPEELVCYTFKAFEAWARDRGCPRTPDRTPRELVQVAVARRTPMYEEAQRMVRMYSELAYAGGAIPREAAQGLQLMWKLMRSTLPEASVRSAPSSTKESRA